MTMLERIKLRGMEHLLTHKSHLAACTLALGVGACGGGGGGGTDPPPNPPAVTFSVSVSVTGSGAVTTTTGSINCGSLCSANVPANTNLTLTATPAVGQTLQSWGGACNSASGNTCTVAVTQATSVSAVFAAPPASGWSSTVTPLSIGGSCCAKVALDAAGRAVAVWLTLEPATPSDNLMTSRFDPSSGWSTPVALESSPRDVGNVALAIDPASGRAVVMWTQGSDTSVSAAWVRHFDPASGWTAPQLVQSASTPAGRADQISIGLDAQANAVAAWSQLDGTRFSVWGNRGTATGTWGSAQLLETEDELGRVDGNPRIAVAPQGDATVVWQSSGGTVASRGTWTNRYTAGAGWSTASQLVAVSGGSAPDIAMDANGNAVMVWGQIQVVSVTEMYALVQAKRYQAGAWGPALQVGRELGANSVLSAPRVEMNSAGSALVVWGQGDESIRATVAPAGAAWPAPTIVKPVGSRAAGSAPVAAIDDQGNAMLTWAQGSNQGGADAMLATRSAQGVWTAGVVHQAAIWGDPFVALNDRGNGLFLWTQFVNTSTGTQVQARRFSSGR
jgi:Divergent InlB B-repeat domain